MKRTIAVTALITAGAVGGLLAATVDLSKLPPSADKQGVTYAKDIKPLLDASCIRCHGSEKPKAGLRLDNLEGLLKGGKEGKVLVPGKSKESKLVIAVAQIDEDSAMPPRPKPGRGKPGEPGAGGPPPGGSGSNAGAGGPPGGGPGGRFGPPPKPLTSEQVGLVRAWIDQGAK